MRNSHNAFHLAIPCRDLDESWEFYVNKLGCGSSRRYEDRITLDFFGDQIVLHLAPEKIDRKPEMYPRHFGLTFNETVDFDRILTRALEQELTFYKDVFVRFAGMPEENRAFFLVDPSNNLVEFKHYKNQDMMY
jgi:extradiol dioxygenase family protein